MDVVTRQRHECVTTLANNGTTEATIRPSVPQQPKPEIKLLFPTPVQVCDVVDAPAINRDLMREIDAVREVQPNTKPQSWACDLYTTIGSPRMLLEREGARRLLTIAQDNVNLFAQTLGFDTSQQRLRIHECWINAYAAGHSQEIHLHRNSVVSGIYYVQAPPGSGATLFYSPFADVMLEPRAVEGNALNAKVTGFPPVAGRMLLFRSHLRHSVMPGTFDGERTTVAFNATC